MHRTFMVAARVLPASRLEREARIRPRRPAYIQHLHGACLRWSGVGSAISLSVAAQPRFCARFGRKQAVSARKSVCCNSSKIVFREATFIFEGCTHFVGLAAPV